MRSPRNAIKTADALKKCHRSWESKKSKKMQSLFMFLDCAGASLRLEFDCRKQSPAPMLNPIASRVYHKPALRTQLEWMLSLPFTQALYQSLNFWQFLNNIKKVMFTRRFETKMSKMALDTFLFGFSVFWRARTDRINRLTTKTRMALHNLALDSIHGSLGQHLDQFSGWNFEFVEEI